MQNAALAAVGLDGWRYQLLPVPPELFEETVLGLGGAGFRGANVTIPHKEAALVIALAAGGASERARKIGAANTLLFEHGDHVWADNTDAPALIESLPFAVAGRSALVLGAGGSARAAVWALLEAGAGEVRVWNRTPERARALSEELGAVAVQVAEPADLLVNCTSSGLDTTEWTFKQLPVGADDLDRYDCVVDFVYREDGTPLVQAARAHGRRVVDGFELLVRQGALSFAQFTGVEAPLDVMRAAVGAR